MIKAYIVDDEPQAIKALQSMLQIYQHDVSVIGTAGSKRDAIAGIKRNSPELLFLDIELTDGLGTDVLQAFPNASFHTIFVTAYEQYALEAFRLNAMDYLVKPIDPDDLERVIHKAERRIQQNEPEQKAKGHRMSVPTSDGYKFIDLDQVIRLQADSNYTHIITERDKPLLVTKTLKSFEQLLKDKGFIRVHQSHMINFRKLDEFLRSDGGILIMNNGDQVPLSRKNKSLIERIIELKLLNL